MNIYQSIDPIWVAKCNKYLTNISVIKMMFAFSMGKKKVSIFALWETNYIYNFGVNENVAIDMMLGLVEN